MSAVEAEQSDADVEAVGEPALEEQLDELEEREEELQERKEALANGEVDPPWPYTSNYAYLIAGAALVAGGGLFAFGEVNGAAGVSFAGALAIIAGAAVGSYGRWFTRHFETGQQPTYDSPDEDAIEVSNGD